MFNFEAIFHDSDRVKPKSQAIKSHLLVNNLKRYMLNAEQAEEDNIGELQHKDENSTTSIDIMFWRELL